MYIANMLQENYCSKNEQSIYTLPKNSYYPSIGLGNLTVEHDGREFSVITSNGSEFAVPNYNLSKDLRGISVETLKKMLAVGYLTINKAGENYALEYRGRLLGGGPLLAFAAYVGTNIAGGLTVALGTVTLNPAICVAGAGMITAAPYVMATLLIPPTL